MKPFIAKVEFSDSSDRQPIRALVESMTDAILFCLADALGTDTAEGNVTPIARLLFETPEETKHEIQGCFDQGYEPDEEEDYGAVEIRRLKDGKIYLDGSNGKAWMTVERWVPDAKRKAEIEAMSKEEMVARILELEVVL